MKFHTIPLMRTAALLVLSASGSCSSRAIISAADGGTAGASAALDTNLPYPAATIEPLVLFFRTLTGGANGEISPTGPLPVYDRQGRKIADLATNLPRIFGSTSYVILEITVHGRVFIAPHSFKNHSPALLPGQAWFHGRTQVVLKVRPGGEGANHRLIGLDTYGEVTFDLVVDKRWGEFQLSPRGRYLLGQTYSDGVIFDSHTGEIIQEGPYLNDGAFAPDDSTFAFLDQSGEEPAVVLLALSAKKQRSIPLPAQLASNVRDLIITAAIDQGFIFRTLIFTSDFASYHSRLWFLSDDGQWISFHENPEARAFETLVGLSRRSRKVIFSRSPVSDGSEFAPGFYSFVPASDINDRVEPLIVNAPPFTPSGELDRDCDAHYSQGRMLFIKPTADENQLVVWPFTSPTPEVIGAVDPLPLVVDAEPPSWRWLIQRTSDSGEIIAVGLVRLSAMMPEMIPVDGMIILDDHGRHLFSLPWGNGILDRTGKLFVHEPRSTDGTREQVVIADIERRSVTRHDIKELSFAVIYRTP